MESNTLVIKAKYGDTLRRFNVRVNEEGQLDLDISGLRAKIIALFNFPPDTADLALTYIDEDGDTVALVDDEDLRDVMRQRLKFLRVDVKLNNDKSGKTARSSSTSTPMSSPRMPNPLPSVNTGVAEVLKTVPEPLRDVLSKLSLDLASKAASSSPVVAELVETISNLGQSFLNNSRQSSVGEGAGSQTATPNVSMAPSRPLAPVVENNSGTQEELVNINSTAQGSLDRGLPGDVKKGVRAAGKRPVDLNMHLLEASNLCDLANDLQTSFNAPVTGDAKDTKKQDAGVPNGKSARYFDGLPGHPDPPRNWLSRSNCPFSGMPMVNDSAVPVSPHSKTLKRGKSVNDAMVGIFHRGVQCDGCGVHPIAGPRYKSLVKEDYDLCSVCFADMGNEADYLKIERPMTYRHPRCLRGPRHPHHWAPPLSHVMRTWGSKPGKSNLDSRFIMDVNVFDGTVMPPSTSFTKIWRMRNNGNVAWPKGTRLVWIGGDRFSHSNFAELEIPEDGIPVNGELDVAVDFLSPELPGRYVSYWKMSSASGAKFGQRVWVLIQVDASLKDSMFEGFQGLNLNLPPESSSLKVHEMIDVNVHPDGVSNFEPFSYTPFSIPLDTLAHMQPTKDKEVSLPMMSASTVDHQVSGALPVPSLVPISSPVPLVAPSSVPLAAVLGPIPSPAAIPGPTTTLVSTPASILETQASFPLPVPLLPPQSVTLDPTPTSVPPSVSYPIIDWPEFLPAGLSQPPLSTDTAVASSEKVALQAPTVSYPAVDWSFLSQSGSSKPDTVKDVATSLENIAMDDAVEKSLLKELDEMGFKQVDLNKEVLRNNGYDLQQSVDALCGVSEWDPILAELKEMGFSDKEMNKKLLEKNNGSIKRVVMDLLRGEEVLDMM